MDFIDERGRLLGAVNVVDALVVLGVTVVLVGGLFLVFGPGQSAAGTGDTRYATVAYTVPLESDAALVDAGDRIVPLSSGDTLEIVDAYRSFTPNGSVYVVARVRYSGTLTVNGQRLYGGDSREYTADQYRVRVAVLAVDGNQTSLAVTEMPVVVSSTQDPTVAAALDPGDTATIGVDPVATVESVSTPDDGRFYVGLTVRVWETGTVPVFDGESIRVGNRLTVVTDEAVLRGRVSTVGTTDVSNVTGSSGG